MKPRGFLALTMLIALSASVRAVPLDIVVGRPALHGLAPWERQLNLARYARLDQKDRQARAILEQLELARLGPKVDLKIAREYRLLGDHDKAWYMLNSIERTDFGKSSLDFKKERIQWYMDKKIYGRAAGEWSVLMRDWQDGNNIQEYNEALFQYIFCVHAYATTKANLDPVKRESYIARAGKLIATVERDDPKMGGLKQKYAELLKAEPALKKAYETQQKELAAAAIKVP